MTETFIKYKAEFRSNILAFGIGIQVYDRIHVEA